MGEVSIFSSEERFGKAGSIPLKAGMKPCFGVRIGDLMDNSKPNSSGILVTNFDIQKAENISVTPTLGTQLFLYVGGESAWQITIQGLLLHGCKENPGFDSIIDWYNKNNVKTAGKPVDLTFNKKVYKGYLYRFQVQSEYKLTNGFSFTASFVGVLKGGGRERQ